MQGYLGLGVLRKSSPGLGVIKGPLGNATDALRTGLFEQWKMYGADAAPEVGTVAGYSLGVQGAVGSAAGKIGLCRTFGGGSNRLELATGTPFNLYPMSVSAWVYSSGMDGFICWHYGGALDGWQFMIGSGKMTFFAYNGGGNNVDTIFTSALSLNTWYHCAITLGPGGVIGYLNGVADGSKAWTGTPSASGYTGAFTIGNTYSSMSGNIDCVKIWNVELTPAQIALDYNGGTGVEL